MSNWIRTAASIESAADRQEFVQGVVGYKGPGLGTVAFGGILAWYLLRGRLR